MRASRRAEPGSGGNRLRPAVRFFGAMGWCRTLAAVVAVLVVSASSGAHATPTAPVQCESRAPSASYTSAVQRAVASGRDLWGEQLLHARGGPTLAAARRFLAPLGRAVQWYRRPLTPTGSYYVPFSFPFSSRGSTVYALHVADGSEIETRVVGGPSLSVYVGSGGERFGSCTSRRRPAGLAAGYLPILETGYTDANGR